MVATTLQSGQLVHVYGTPTGEAGIYLEQPRARDELSPPQRVYCYYHRGTPVLPSQGWRLLPFCSEDLWLLTPLDTVVRPELVRGAPLWRLPAQPGVPDLAIGWLARGASPGWACPADVPTIPGGLLPLAWPLPRAPSRRTA